MYRPGFVLICCLLLQSFAAWSQEVKLSKKYYLVHWYREGCRPCARLDSVLALWVPTQDSLHYERRLYTEQKGVALTHLPALSLYAPNDSLLWTQSGFRAYEWAQKRHTHFLRTQMAARYDSAAAAMSGEWQEALKSAKRSGKLILAWVTHPECYACHQLFVETWLQDSLYQRLTPYFDAYLIDITRDANRYFRNLLNYRSLPAVFVLNDKERTQAEITGYLPAPLLTDSLLQTAANIGAAASFVYEQSYKAALRKAKNNRRALVWAVIGEKNCEACESVFTQYLQYAPLRSWTLRYAIAGYFLFRQLPDRHKLRFLSEERPFVLVLTPEGNIIEHLSPAPAPQLLYDRLQNY
ncbi:MAG: hypothetical protein KatS3mg033_1249 [Thermonema sp.]|nr:MAG: hypothetical protein KatS3mg033_1249 [Thermonema sp.]